MAQERVLHGRPTLIGKDLVGQFYNSSIINVFTIVEKARIVNYSDTAYYVRLLIRKLGQTVQVPDQFVIHDKVMPPHTTYVVKELFGESFDFPANMIGDVLDGVGNNAIFGKVSFSMTMAEKRW